MKTDELIEILSTNLEPVKRVRLGKIVAGALAIGGGAAFCLMLATVGLRPDLATGNVSFMTVKLSLTLTVIGIGSALLMKLIRPGQERAWKLFGVALLPILGFLFAGVIALGRSADGNALFRGTHWGTCLVCIPLFAAVPYGALIWALRQGAPTNLKRAGAIAGLVAGALGATAYVFHCQDDSLPFIGIWYTALISLCAFVGAKLGPRLLRW